MKDLINTRLLLELEKKLGRKLTTEEVNVVYKISASMESDIEEKIQDEISTLSALIKEGKR